jgi:hypothetical protein|tara:strand:+ start:457 stop:678 length:222 start_codon:yes stop_codon:yes gene_type:complete
LVASLPGEKMKEIKLPKAKERVNQIISTRVEPDTLRKWNELRGEGNEKRIRSKELMEYMINYFYEETIEKKMK